MAIQQVLLVNRLMVSDSKVVAHQGNIAIGVAIDPITATQLALSAGATDKGKTPSGWQKWDIYPPRSIAYFTRPTENKSITVAAIEAATANVDKPADTGKAKAKRVSKRKS